jgi:hypothetical protein
MPLAGGAVDVLFTPSDGTEIFVAGGSVYTVDADVVSRADPSTRVYSVIAGGQGDVAGFASDDGFVYWTVPGDGTADPTTGGKVLRTPL